VPGREGGKKSFDGKVCFSDHEDRNEQSSVKGERAGRSEDYSLTYPSLCAVFTVPGVAKDGIG